MPATFGSYPATAHPGGGYQPPSGRRQRTGRNRALLIGLCVALVAAVSTAGWLALRPSGSSALTFAGKPIRNADAALSAAQATTTASVSRRHGSAAADTRCYFARPAAPAKGTKKSDIDANVYCGPVLFVDGDKNRTYLSYALSATSARGGVDLTASSTPQSAAPQSVPAGLTLSRPDHLAPGTGGSLAVPSPPPAAPGYYSTRPDLNGQQIPAAPTTAVIGSRTGGVRLTHLGVVPRVGHGDGARAAASGQELIAFQIAAGPSDDPVTTGFPEGAITVSAAGATHPVPRSQSTVVFSVPRAGPATLSVSDAGITQQLSLTTGQPAAANLAVTRRVHHTGPGQEVKHGTYRYYDSHASVTRPIVVQLVETDLGYWSGPSNSIPAPSHTSALLHVRVRFTFTGPLPKPFTGPTATGPFGVDPPLVTLHLPGGQIVRARNLVGKSEIYLVFAVPASFTSGQVVVSGHLPANTNHVFEGIKGAITFPITIPAG